jgi:hypothetical protein
MVQCCLDKIRTVWTNLEMAHSIQHSTWSSSRRQSTERETKIIGSRGMGPIRSKMSINDTVLEYIRPNN